MHFTGTDWTVIGSVAVALAGKIWVDIKWLGRHQPKTLAAAEQDVMKVGKDIGGELAGLAKAPAVAAVEAHLKMQLDGMTKQFEKSTLGQLAAEAVAGVEKMGKTFSALSPEEVNAITLHIATAATDFGVKVTQKQIKDALQAADTAAQAIPQVPVIAAAAKFASEVQNATAPADTAPATTSALHWREVTLLSAVMYTT